MPKLPKPPLPVPLRTSPETLTWLKELDSYCQQTYGVRSFAKELREARAQFHVVKPEVAS